MLSGKKLHFMHIPKTGGISLFNFLEKQFKHEDVCPIFLLGSAPRWVPDDCILKGVPHEKIRNYQFFKGHLGWVPRALFNNDEIETITFLREPFSRLLSYYNFVKENPSLWDNIPNRWPTFNDFVLDKEFGLEFHSNWQTKSFCADIFFKEFYNRAPNNEYVKNNGVLAWGEINLSPQQMLELALKRLHQCAFVGLTEHFDESFEWLCAQYGWLLPKETPKQNTSKKSQKSSEVNTIFLNKIKELNQLDYALYAEGVKIFKDRKKNRFYINRSDSYTSLLNQEEIKFTFADKVIGEGWHAREGARENSFSWNASTRSTLIFSVNKHTSYFISFNIIHSVIPDFYKKLMLCVNSFPIRLSYKNHPNGGLIFEGIIPIHALYKDHGLLELSFNVPELIRPNDANAETMDSRKLGFALKSLEIRSANPSTTKYHQNKIREASLPNDKEYQEALKLYENRKLTYQYHDHDDFYVFLLKEKVPQDNIQLNFEDEMTGEGWSIIEGAPPHQYCWTISAKSTLIFLVKQNVSYLFSLRIHKTLITKLHKKLTLTANGIPISLRCKRYLLGDWIFQGKIPLDANNKQGLLELTFSVPKLTQAKNNNGIHDDHRHLGFALKTLTLKSLTKVQQK